MNKVRLYLVFLGLTAPSFAEPSSIASGLPQSTSVDYRADHGINGLISSVSTSSNYENRAGYVGQLTDVRTFNTYPDPAVEAVEGEEIPLVVGIANDDGTTNRISTTPGAVIFSNPTGPIQSLTPLPGAQLGRVYEDTTATYQAEYQGMTALGTILVKNVWRDDFGSYAGDGIGDEWQINYFGENNPLAAPGEDPDHDGQDNAFEFLSGYAPDDGSERLLFELVEKGVNQATLGISKVVPTTRYEIQRSIDLGQTVPWTGAVTFVPLIAEVNAQRILSTSATKDFFRLRLEPATPLANP